ncbi:MAG: hypothetical protein R3296_05500 [Oleiphilaceae bacterium]|nr:hypothetical protein [Oleiphilaceae bacterium]
MNKKQPLLLLVIITASLLASNAFAETLIRIGCVGEAEGARVFINGEFADNCPANLFIEPGRKRIRVVKSVGEGYERVYETELVLRADSPKRVNVELSQPQMTAEARQRLEQEKQRVEQELARKTLEAARAGEIDAMRQMATFYRRGKGVEQSLEKARFWDNKASDAELAEQAEALRQRAEDGSIDAMRELAEYYDQGRGVEKDSDKAALWRNKAHELEANRTLAEAEAGDVKAMEAMSELYAEGKGVRRDPYKSDEWAIRVREIRQTQLEQEKAMERQQKAQEKLNNIDFFQYTKEGRSMLGRPPNTPLEHTVYSLFVPPSVAMGLLADLTAAPTKTVQKIRLKNDIAARPSTFANPDSMMAKAHRLQNP